VTKVLSKFSVKKPYTVVVAVLLVAILGVVSLINMSTDLLPSINLPYAVVSTTYIGASPEEIELAVTRPIEQRMASISNIKSIRSVSREHMSLVILEFNESTNMDSVVIEIRESLDMIKGFMPENVGSPMIMKLNPDMMPVMVLSASVEGQKISESSQFIESRIIPELESIEGVASVTASGLVDNEVHVILRDEKIAEVNNRIMMFEVNMTVDMIANILKGQNFSMPAGYILEDNINYLVRTGDKIKDFEELKNLSVMVLPIPGVEPIKLSDVADVFTIDNSQTMYSKVNGNDAVTLQIQKQTEYTTADIAKSVRARVDQIKENYEDVEIVALLDQGEYVDMVVNSISMNLIYGGILAIIILLIFLRDFKPTIIVGFAIPISLITAFVMMYFSKITLNIISMGGLALGVGMLVDNSIVVIENIYRMRSEGRSAREAAIEGAAQVSGAIFASTLTTVAVFLPIVFTQGITRQIFTDMGLTIAYSLFASLIIALTLVPMMSSKILSKNVNGDHKIFDSIKKAYTKVLTFSLRRKWLVVVTVLFLFVASIGGALRMGTELFPASDSGQLSVTLTMPSGSSFEDTVKEADKAVEIISTIEEVQMVGASIGGGRMGGFMGGMRGSNNQSVSINITLREDKKRTTNEVSQLIRDNTADLDGEISISETGMGMSGFSSGGISIDIRGRELDMLQAIAKDVASIVTSVQGTVEVSDGFEDAAPEIKVTVDKDKSIARGLTVAQVYMEINKLTRDEAVATTITLGNKEFSVFVKDENSNNELSRSELENLIIISPQGEAVILKDIADIEEASGYTSINRNNQQRYVTVSAGLAEGYNIGLVSRDVENKLSEYEVPEGYTITMGGDRQAMNESFRDMFLMLALAVAFIYLIMVAQFQSLLSPFIVMFTIPLAFTGGFMGLMVTGNPISMISLVGLLILCGVVVNNGIVFVDYVNKLRESGMNKYDAIIKAGNDRLRPILMTALTTIFALSTLSIGAGSGTEMMQPMAITTIGGLLYSTLLTLVFIPVLYDSFHKK
jgi:CzcA family heavy metal efflux pump